MRLPEWNDLSNDQREAIVAVVDYNVGGTEAEHFAGQIGLDVFLKVRELVTVELPPLTAALHEGGAGMGVFAVSDSADFDPAGGEYGPGKTCITWTFACPRQTVVGPGLYELRFVRALTAEESARSRTGGVGAVLAGLGDHGQAEASA